MKNKITAGRKYMFAAMLALALSMFAAAQTETLKVGDTVVSGNTGQTGRIEAIDGTFAKVRYGSGAYDFHMEPLSTLKSPKNAANAANRKEQGAAFRAEAGNQYFNAVALFYQFYKPELATLKGGDSANSIKEAMVELAKLDALCKSKYPGIKNDSETDWVWRYGDWCEIAANRQDWAQVATGSVAKRIGNFNSIERDLRDAFNDSEGFVSEDAQKLIYEREAWERRKAAAMAPKFKELGTTIPADFFANVESQADELKKLIDRTAPTRSFDSPPYQDAASQAMARREFARMYPGIQILKIGATYAAGKVYKNALGIPTNQHKTGFALVKMPNRPYCQARQWSFIQTYVGGGRFSAPQPNFSSGQSGGIFMKCQ